MRTRPEARNNRQALSSPLPFRRALANWRLWWDAGPVVLFLADKHRSLLDESCIWARRCPASDHPSMVLAADRPRRMIPAGANANRSIRCRHRQRQAKPSVCPNACRPPTIGASYRMEKLPLVDASTPPIRDRQAARSGPSSPDFRTIGEAPHPINSSLYVDASAWLATCGGPPMPETQKSALERPRDGPPATAAQSDISAGTTTISRWRAGGERPDRREPSAAKGRPWGRPHEHKAERRSLIRRLWPPASRPTAACAES
jgi:hypothetical protein